MYIGPVIFVLNALLFQTIGRGLRMDALQFQTRTAVGPTISCFSEVRCTHRAYLGISDTSRKRVIYIIVYAPSISDTVQMSL